MDAEDIAVKIGILLIGGALPEKRSLGSYLPPKPGKKGKHLRFAGTACYPKADGIGHLSDAFCSRSPCDEAS